MAARKSKGPKRKTQAAPEPKGIPSVAYYRMSSDKQETSIPDQRVAVEKFAEKNGYRIDWEYADEGISGDATEKRAGFQQMIADATNGEFEVILCWDMDRFGRFDLYEAGYWIKPLRDAGVRLVTIGQGAIDWNDFAGRIVSAVQQKGKHAFLRDLARNTMRGRVASTMKGNWSFGEGMTPFGYRVKEKKLAVVPEEAEVVREVFRRCIEGESAATIRKALSQAGHRDRKGETFWKLASVRYILSNPVYTGSLVFGKRRGGKYFQVSAAGDTVPASTGKGSRLSPYGEDRLVVEGAHEPIITDKDFERAKVAQMARQRQTSPAKGPTAFALSGLVVCAECGRQMHGRRSAHAYICSNYNTYGRSVCNRNAIASDDILRLVADRLLGYLRGDEVRRDLAALVDMEASKEKRPSVDLDRLRSRLQTMDRKIDKCSNGFWTRRTTWWRP